jgi:hypothetical protein
LDTVSVWTVEITYYNIENRYFLLPGKGFYKFSLTLEDSVNSNIYAIGFSSLEIA